METPKLTNIESFATGDTLRRLRERSGQLTSIALQRLDEQLPWYRELPADDRSWVGLVAQAGIRAFIDWYAAPHNHMDNAAQVFAAAPPELTRSISLQQTLELVRLVVEVVEDETPDLAATGAERELLEAVLRYSREVAFSAAAVYARAAEVRGAWDARLEALIVDGILRGEPDSSILSRAAALGWDSTNKVLVMIGYAQAEFDENRVAQLRRLTRKTARDVLVGIHGQRLVIVIGGNTEQLARVGELVTHFRGGPVVIGPVVSNLARANDSALEAIAALNVAHAWQGLPRPVGSGELLPERALAGDEYARDRLFEEIYTPIVAQGEAMTQTITLYLEHGRSLEATARELFVHPNTVRYRLRKLAEITGWDALQARDSYVLHIALSLGKIKKSPNL